MLGFLVCIYLYVAICKLSDTPRNVAGFSNTNFNMQTKELKELTII